MLSYRHSFHAGGPADVQKHAALCLLLAHLESKDKPFCVIDLYAGDGIYDLAGEHAEKIREHEQGIARLWPGSDAPASLKRYFLSLKSLNPGGKLKSYPGSPAIAKTFLREQDSLILNELHPSSYAALKKWAGRDKRISIHKRDGMEALLGLVPPTIKRGVVLIDPSYEVKTEYADIPQKLAEAARKWPQGIYCLWYPILGEGRHKTLVDSAIVQIEASIFRSEILLTSRRLTKTTKSEDDHGLLGTGLLVLNPPWQFDTNMADAGAWIVKAMTGGVGRHTASWLKRGEVKS